MQDQPHPSEIIAAVARFLKTTVAAETEGATAFNARVAANALEMMVRQLALAPAAAEARELASLETLLGRRGDLRTLNTELSRRLAAGEIDLSTPGLADHLWDITLTKLAVDQPKYWGYQAALADGAPTQEP